MKHPGDVIPKQFRNSGYSLGLQHPFIYANDLVDWIVWHRETGVIDTVCQNEREASKRCHELNGLSETPDAATIAAIDETP